MRATWCVSLKDKRSIVKGLIAGFQNKFNVSVCESGSQDIPTHIELTVAALVFDHAQGDSTAENLTVFVENATDAELYGIEKEYR
jgi:Uncharacterized protein conserved in bacteria